MTTTERLLRDLRHALEDIHAELADTEHRGLVNAVLLRYGLAIPEPVDAAILRHPAGRRLETR